MIKQVDAQAKSGVSGVGWMADGGWSMVMSWPGTRKKIREREQAD